MPPRVPFPCYIPLLGAKHDEGEYKGVLEELFSLLWSEAWTKIDCEVVAKALLICAGMWLPDTDYPELHPLS